MALTHGGLGGAAVQQMEKVPADRVIVGLDIDALAIVAPVVPVQQHRALRSEQAVGGITRARRAVVLFLGQHGPERRDAGAQHVHRVGGRRERARGLLDRFGQAAQRLQVGLVSRELRDVWAACHGRAGRRSPRIRRLRRYRGCRSRGRRDHCPCARPCTAPCCRRRRRKAPPTSWAWVRWVRPSSGSPSGSARGVDHFRAAKSASSFCSYAW